MEKLAQKSKHYILRSLLMIASLCLILIVILQIGLLVAINALNTGKAHDFIQAQVTSAMAASGYNATFDKLFYDPVRGFTLYNLAVLDKDGTIATVDKFSLDMAFSKIPFKQLDVIVSAGNISLIRLPETADQTEKTPLQPFDVPNIYFKNFKISHLNIDKLIIDEKIAGTTLTFSPDLKATVKLDNNIHIDTVLLPKPENKIGDINLPEKLEFTGGFSPSTLSFALNKLFISSDDYEVKGNGEGQLIAGGKIDIKIDGQYPDLKKLTQDNFESASLLLNISGDYDQPLMNMNSVIHPANLAEKGLESLNVNATAYGLAENLRADIIANTKYQNEPISLNAKLLFNNNILTLESLKGAGPEITLDGAGTFSTQNNMFDGKIDVSAADLSYYKNLLSLDIAGQVKTEVIFNSQNDVQSADIKASLQKIKFDTIQLGRADAKIHFNDVKYLWPQTGNIQISDLSVSDGMFLDSARMDLKDIGNEAYTISLVGNAHVPSAVSFKGSADLSDITNEFPTVRNIDLKTILGKSTVMLAGAVNPQTIDLKISTQNFRGSDIPAVVSDALSNIRLNGDVTMTGTSASPVTTAKISLNGLNTGAYKNLDITANLNHQDHKVALSILGKGAGIKTLTANANFPLGFGLWPFTFDLDMDAPLSGEIVGDLDLETISKLFLPPTQKFSANLKANGTIAGTLGAPDAKGTATLRNGQFTDDQNGIELRAININSSFTNHSVIFQSMTATDGEKGVMKGNGHIDFSGDQNTDLSLSMSKFHLPKSNLADGVMDANFTLAKANDGYALNGLVDIKSMNIIVPETFQSKIPELNIVERKKKSVADNTAKTISLAVKVNAPNQVFVRGWGLDAEFGGELDISGDATAPLFDGNLASKRGRYEEFGKRFTLERANLRFQGEMPPSPYLDIEATTPANDVKASILLAGPVTKPAITFSSVPALPQDEVLSRLLFGQDTAKITPFQAIQLAQTLRRFSGEGGGSGLDPLEMIRSATGLDDISVDTDANGETNVGVGKYLTDKVYLEFEKGKAAGSAGANIQIEVTPSINVQSEIGQDAQAGGGIFWKKDY